MAMVRWEELPQRRRDEIDNGCVALSGMTERLVRDQMARALNTPKVKWFSLKVRRT
jgi:hypothetical protein